MLVPLANVVSGWTRRNLARRPAPMASTQVLWSNPGLAGVGDESRPSVTSVIQDLRFAARLLVRSPRFTVPAVLALALGIGATSAIFSVVRGVALRPLPYSSPDRIVAVFESNARRNRNVIASSNFVEWRARNRSFAHLGMVGPARLNLVLGGHPEEVAGTFASADVFPALGVQPALGRVYGPPEDEEGNDRVIVVSHNFWRTRLGARADVIGTTITTNGVPRTLVGVMPPDLTLLGERTDFLIPYGWTIERLRTAPGRGSSFGWPACVTASHSNRRPAI